MPTTASAGRSPQRDAGVPAVAELELSATEDLPELPALVERVLELVDAVPRGRVTSYGRVADAVGGLGPRQVGAVMARYGGLTCWWRVVDAGGRLPDGLARRAQARWREEGTPLVAGPVPRVRMAAALWVPPGAS